MHPSDRHPRIWLGGALVTRLRGLFGVVAIGAGVLHELDAVGVDTKPEPFAKQLAHPRGHLDLVDARSQSEPEHADATRVWCHSGISDTGDVTQRVDDVAQIADCHGRSWS